MFFFILQKLWFFFWKCKYFSVGQGCLHGNSNFARQFRCFLACLKYPIGSICVIKNKYEFFLETAYCDHNIELRIVLWRHLCCVKADTFPQKVSLGVGAYRCRHIYLFIHLSFCLAVWLSGCLSVCLFIYLSICLTICQSD